MKLNESQFQQSLKQATPSLGYWLHSDEPLLLIEACSQVSQAAQKAGFSDKTIVNADNQTDWQSIFSNANALSLFAEKSFIDIRLPTAKPSAAAQKAINTYFENPNPDSLILISSPKLDASFTRGKTYKALEQQLDVVMLWPIDSQQLPNWLQQRLSKHKLTIDSEALQLFADSTEGNLLAAQQQIMQLSLLAEERHISFEQLQEVLINSARFDVFGTIEKVLNGDAKGAIRALRGLQHEGLAPANISWVFCREVQKLANIREDAKQHGPDKALQQNGVWKRQERAYRQTLNRVKQAQLQRCLQLSKTIDAQSKGQAAGDPWDTIEQLILLLTGATR